ncbi:MAG: VanZ family protein [Gammaproteobacteria bacterium]|nr:VanZ family protein [Gammaproteobacteria bacterium]
MKTVREFFTGPWSVIWIITLVCMPLLSLFGRQLQHGLLASIGREVATLMITVPLLALCALGVLWLRRRSSRWYLHLIWIVLLFAALPLALERFEERMHFVMFGIFGFSSYMLYPLKGALMAVYAMSGGDELLQWWLPSRVGDWRDVFMNLLAGTGGLLLAHVGRRER